MSWVHVTDFDSSTGGFAPAVAAERAKYYCQRLEEGEVLFFDGAPFDLPEADRNFLLSQRQSGFKGHKNISYRPKTDVLRGDATESPEDTKKLQDIMRRYSAEVAQFMGKFLSPYAGRWITDFASFRSLEEAGRDLVLHKRNDLVHVDAFPTRPTHGGRILRVFTNVNPQKPRVWEVTDRFDVIAKKYSNDAGLEGFAASASSLKNVVTRRMAPLLKAVGMRGIDRSAYDRFMLRFHDYLKENDDYQKNYPKTRIEFPPNSTWLVYTDTVPHSVLSGQFAIEQTFIIPMAAMVCPATAPIRVLESLCGKTLSD